MRDPTTTTTTTRLVPCRSELRLQTLFPFSASASTDTLIPSERPVNQPPSLPFFCVATAIHSLIRPCEAASKRDLYSQTAAPFQYQKSQSFYIKFKKFKVRGICIDLDDGMETT